MLFNNPQVARLLTSSTRSIPATAALVLLLKATTVESSAADPVEAFKGFLSNPPCYSQILYSEVTCDDTVVRTFHAAACNEHFFTRQLTGYENIDFPISFTNRNRSIVYSGRLGDSYWQIGGYDLFLSVKPNMESPDATAVAVRNKYLILGDLLNFGSQHLLPGSNVWNGNEFTAQASLMARQSGIDQFQGEIVVENGWVTRMIVPGSGVWDYKYPEEPSNLPFGIPREIIHLRSGYKCESKLVINEMIVGDAKRDISIFDPKSHIDSSVMILHLRSNNVEIVQGTNNPLVTKITEEELAPVAAKIVSRKRSVRIAVVIGLFVLAISTSIWVLWRRSAR